MHTHTHALCHSFDKLIHISLDPITGLSHQHKYSLNYCCITVSSSEEFSGVISLVDTTC